MERARRGYASFCFNNGSNSYIWRLDMIELSNEEMKWLNETVERNRKGMEQTGIFVGLMGGTKPEQVQVIQFGLAIFKEDPIYLLVEEGHKLPRHLRKVADGIAYFDPKDPEGMQKAMEQLRPDLELYKKNKEEELKKRCQ